MLAPYVYAALAHERHQVSWRRPRPADGPGRRGCTGGMRAHPHRPQVRQARAIAQ